MLNRVLFSSVSGSVGAGGCEMWGLQCGSSGESLLGAQPVYLPAPQRLRQDPSDRGWVTHTHTHPHVKYDVQWLYGPTGCAIYQITCVLHGHKQKDWTYPYLREAFVW